MLPLLLLFAFRGLRIPTEERDGVYAQQLLLLQQKLQAEAAALSILKMQLSSAFKVTYIMSAFFRKTRLRTFLGYSCYCQITRVSSGGVLC